MDNKRCQCCGQKVKVFRGEDGTNSYVSLERNEALEEAAQEADIHGADHFEPCCSKLGACGEVIAKAIRALKTEGVE